MSIAQVRPKILIVEDDRKLAKALIFGIEAAGYDVSSAASAEEGFFLVHSLQPDLLLLDLTLPHRNGLDILRQIRSEGIDIRVLILTSHNAVENRVEGFNSGVDDYLGKPFSFPELVAGIAGYEIAKGALQPLDQMAARAEQITAHNLHDRLEVKNVHDELGHMAQVLNQLLQRLEEAFGQLKSFTADAAHELRTPLASLRTVGEVVLQEAEGTGNYREAIGSILEETARLNQTIEGLLLLAKAEASQPGQRDTEFFLPELVDEVLALLGLLIEEKNLTILEDRDRSESLTVRADRSLMRVALVNVLHNAVKFSPMGSILRMNYTSQGEPEPFVEVSVQDEGPGLAPDEHQRIFERFFTGSRETTAASSGTGLGLSITKLVIERNGGRVFFDEAVRHGARCIIRMPVWNSP